MRHVRALASVMVVLLGSEALGDSTTSPPTPPTVDPSVEVKSAVAKDGTPLPAGWYLTQRRFVQLSIELTTLRNDRTKCLSDLSAAQNETIVAQQQQTGWFTPFMYGLGIGVLVTGIVFSVGYLSGGGKAGGGSMTNGTSPFCADPTFGCARVAGW